jgi:hypothetical protein
MKWLKVVLFYLFFLKASFGFVGFTPKNGGNGKEICKQQLIDQHCGCW